VRSSGARARDGSYIDQPVTPAAEPGYPAQTYPAETYPTETYPAQTYPGQTTPETYPALPGRGDDQSRPSRSPGRPRTRGTGGERRQGHRQGAGQRVGSEARTQARNVATDVRDRVSRAGPDAERQAGGGIRQSRRPARRDARRPQRLPAAHDGLAGRRQRRQLADYLDRQGPRACCARCRTSPGAGPARSWPPRWPRLRGRPARQGRREGRTPDSTGKPAATRSCPTGTRGAGTADDRLPDDRYGTGR
jgi:hypothetical protein